jgi:hypothetical protein
MRLADGFIGCQMRRMYHCHPGTPDHRFHSRK